MTVRKDGVWEVKVGGGVGAELAVKEGKKDWLQKVKREDKEEEEKETKIRKESKWEVRGKDEENK